MSDLDLFVFHDQRRSKTSVPPSVSVLRSVGVPFPQTSPQFKWRLDWVVHRGVPLEVVMARADPAPRLALRDWARPPYDLVWFWTAPAYEWTGRPDFGPAIVDLMDLEDVKSELRAGLLADQLRAAPAGLRSDPLDLGTRPASTPGTGVGSSSPWRRRWNASCSRVTSTPTGPDGPTSP